MFPFQLYKSLEETSLTIIDDTDQLRDLLEKLKMVKEIAIDLEVGCDDDSLQLVSYIPTYTGWVKESLRVWRTV